MPRPLAAAVIILACALLAWQLNETSNVRILLGDFRAFYCGGSMVAHGENPYAAAPLQQCEQTPMPFGLHSVRNSALPAPFPGYALAVFTVFSLLPYPVAAAVWLLILIACTVLSCIWLGRLCERSAMGVFALIAVAFSISIVPYGELAPVIFAALTAGALALRAGNRAGVVIALAIIALLPHVALPVFIAVFIWSRPLRLPVLLLALALLAADLAVGGPKLALSYVFNVLPDHAASEVGFITQYSLTWLVQALGASDRVALLAGNISYGVMVVAGVWLAGLLARNLRDVAFLMLLPAAFAVTGGSFIHYSEITLALPAALLLFVRTEGRAKVAAACAVFLAALPWQAVVTQPELIVPIALGALAVGALVLHLSASNTLRAGLAAALWCALCLILAWRLGPQTAPHLKSAFDPTLAEASWARHISDQTASSGIVWWIPKLPTWIGLALLAIAAALAATGVKPRARAV